MSGIGVLHGAWGGGASTLAAKLAAIAEDAARAAALADGSYLLELPRRVELQKAFTGAARAAAMLEDLKPRIAVLEGGEDGLRLAQRAIDDLDAGRRALRNGLAVEDDALRSGAAISDAIATSTAGSHLRDASAGLRGISDMAVLESTSADDLFAAITRHAG